MISDNTEKNKKKSMIKMTKNVQNNERCGQSNIVAKKA